MVRTHEISDIQRFDRWSDTYEDSPLQRRFFDGVHQAVLAIAADGPAPETILDVGCGTGRLLRAAGAQWSAGRLIGVDPAPGMVTVARRLTPHATFDVGTAEQLPFPDDFADLMMSTISFHHWRDQAAGLREVARVLRPGGQFILVDIAAPTWLSRLARHGRFQSRARLRTLFTRADLTIQRQQSAVSRFVLVTVGVRPAVA